MRAQSLAPLLSLITACSSSSSSPPNPGSADAGVAPSGKPAPCPEGSRESGTTCETTLSLSASPQSVAPGRDHHTSHVWETSSGAYLYVLGGTPAWASIYDDIQRAKIGSDGALSAFEPAGTMHRKRAGHSTVRVKNKIIVLGGSVQRGAGMNWEPTTDVGTIGEDGRIGDFMDGPLMKIGTMHHSTELKGDYIFVFGGRGTVKGVSVDNVMRTKLDADGTPGPFEALAPLPEPRSHMMSFQYGEYVYIAGGLTGNPTDNPPSRKDIIRAKLGADGSLGEWEAAGSIQKGLSVSAAQVFARRVFFFGGLSSATSYTDQIQSAAFDEEGFLGEAASLSVKLSTPRAHVHQTPMFGRFIYAVGGLTNSEESTGGVDIGTFAAP